MSRCISNFNSILVLFNSSFGDFSNLKILFCVHLGMGNLSYFLHSVGFRGFIFRGFGFVTSDDLINRTLKMNPKGAFFEKKN